MDDMKKLEMYLELEPDLVIFDQTKNEIEIKKLKQENMIVNQLQDEITKLKENQARIDQKTIQELQMKGVLPNELL